MSMSCTCRVLNHLLELEDPRHRPQLFLWCVNSLLVLLDERHSLWTTCGVSEILRHLDGELQTAEHLRLH